MKVSENTRTSIKKIRPKLDSSGIFFDFFRMFLGFLRRFFSILGMEGPETPVKWSLGSQAKALDHHPEKGMIHRPSWKKLDVLRNRGCCISRSPRSL